MSLVDRIIDVEENDLIELSICNYAKYDNKTVRAVNTYMTVETVYTKE